MIFIAGILAANLAIVAFFTKIWLLAYIGAGLFAGALLMGVMADNNKFGSALIMLVAVVVPVLYLIFQRSWIVFASYAAIGMMINADSLDVYDEVYQDYTLEGKIHEFFDKRLSDQLMGVYSIFCAGVWMVFAVAAVLCKPILFVVSLYLIIRALIVMLRAEGDFWEGDRGEYFEQLVDISGLKPSFGKKGSSRRFSVPMLIISLVLLALSLLLTILESQHLYTGMLDHLGDVTEFMVTGATWFPTTRWMCSVMVGGYGFLVAVLAFFGMLVAAVVEAALSLIWLVLALIALIIALILMVIFGYAIPPLICVGLLVVAILTFTRKKADDNRVISVLCFLVSVASCVVYFYFLRQL